MAMPDLRPCPFCGSPAQVLREMEFSSMNYRYFVACTKCGIETARIYRHPDAAAAVWNRRPISTNADRIRAMDDAELAGVLEAVADAGAEAWFRPFSEAHCKGCPKTEAACVQTGQVLPLNECFVDGACPHGKAVDWWLRQTEVSGNE